MPEAARNWYVLLGVDRGASDGEISSAVEKLSRTSAALAVTNPERSQQIREIVRLIRRDLLSGPAPRSSYDQLLRTAEQPSRPSAIPLQPQPRVDPAPPLGGLTGRFLRFLKEGWTCQSCGAPSNPGDRFCAACGGEITPVLVAARAVEKPSCPSCGVQVRAEDRFCAACGAPLVRS